MYLMEFICGQNHLPFLTSLSLWQTRLEAQRSTRSAKASKRAGWPSLWSAGVLEPAPPCSLQRFGGCFEITCFGFCWGLEFSFWAQPVMLPSLGSVWPCRGLRQPGFRNGSSQEPGSEGRWSLCTKELWWAGGRYQVRNSSYGHTRVCHWIVFRVFYW